jgi:hypothetical protein
MNSAANERLEIEDELLTSYLDQELSIDERVSLEKRLVDEEPLRKRLAEMRRAWDLLDELPETPFTPNFTQSTLEMVAIDLEKERDLVAPILGLPLPSWFPKLSTRVRTAILIALTSCIGIIAGMVLRNRHREADAHEIALASRITTLQDFPDLEILRPMLSTPGWKDLLEIDSIRERILTIHPTGHHRSEVEEYVSRLDTHQKEILWNGLQSLKRLEPVERQKLEASFSALIHLQKPDPDLQKLASVLNGILQNMPMSERAEIRSLPDERKVLRLSQELCFQSAKLHNSKLTPDEKKHIQEWKIGELIPEIANSSPFYSPDRNPDMMIAGTLFMALRENMASISGQEELIDLLCDGLRTETKQLIRGMSTRNQYIVALSLALERKLDIRTAVSTEDLYKQYELLEPARRDKMDLSRPEAAREDLENRVGRERRQGDRNSPKGGGGPLGPGGFVPGGEGPRPDRPFDPPFGAPPGGRFNGPGNGGPPNGGPPNGGPPNGGPRPEGPGPDRPPQEFRLPR